MDQSISCQDINHIYKHPLSILIHLKFQDKDGCSKSGSRELLFRLKITNRGNIEEFFNSAILDSRGVPIYQGASKVYCDDRDDEMIILGFKQLILNIFSQIPIVQEEREALSYLLKNVTVRFSRDNNETSDILDNPILGSQEINSVCGHVIGIHKTLNFTSSNLSQRLSLLTQFKHLRSLRFEIAWSWENQEQFYEELGDQLGSKLVHLGINASYYIRRLELLSNQIFKFSSLKTLLLSIDSRDFNPSFVNLM